MTSEHVAEKDSDHANKVTAAVLHPDQHTHTSTHKPETFISNSRSSSMHYINHLRRLTSREFVIVPLIIGIGAVITAFLLYTKPVVSSITTMPPTPPKVLVLHATPTTTEIPVESYGVVHERTRLALHTEVTGRIIWVAPNLQTGQTIKAGEPLIRIDATEFNLLSMQAQAEITEAKLQLAKIEAQSKLKIAEWRAANNTEPSIFYRMEPELANARTRLITAQTQYDLILLKIKKSIIHAPFSGRVRATYVESGLYVTTGSLLAEVFKTDYSRVRFPLNRSQLSFLNLSQEQNLPIQKRIVKVFPQPEQPECFWEGMIVALEGEVDPKTQTIFGIADIPSPYKPAAQNCLPLISGSFVRILEFAPQQKNTYHITSRALLDDKHVYIVDSDDRLAKREVQIIYEDAESVVIGAGLTPQMRIVISMPNQMVAGMRVTPVFDESQQTN